MPTMIRPKNKARKIAWNILGVPAQIQSERMFKKRKLDKEILYDETRRLR